MIDVPFFDLPADAPSASDPVADLGEGPYLDDLDFLQTEAVRLRLLDLLRRRTHDADDAHAPHEFTLHDLAERLDTAARCCAGRLADTVAEGRFTPALEHLVAQHALDPLEREALLILAVHALDPHTFASIHSHVPEVRDLAFLLGPTLRDRLAARRLFYRSGRLVRAGLVRVDVHFTNIDRGDVHLDARLVDLLAGQPTTTSDLVEGAHLFTPTVSFNDVVLPPRQKERLLEAVTAFEPWREAQHRLGLADRIGYGRGLVMLFHGPPGTGKTMLAHALARHLGKRLLLVNFSAAGRSGELLRFVFREAALQDAVLFFDECEEVFGRRDGEMLTELERFDGLAILATNVPEHLDEPVRRRITLAVPFALPDAAQRAEIWRRLTPCPAPDVDPSRLAQRFELSGGLVKNAVLVALSRAVARDAEHPLLTQQDLEEAAAEQRRGLVPDGRPAVPAFGLERLVLEAPTDASVRAVVAAERARPSLEAWGLLGPTAGAATVALFEGPPGTGKTLAAAALAGELGRPLHTVTAGRVLGRYVGDTERNLSKAFAEAREAGAVLLLDEADSLLAARTSVATSTDRYANADVNELLHLLDTHAGLVVLTTNHPAVFDDALARRLRVRVPFTRPDAPTRARLWRLLLPSSLPLAPDVDHSALATRFALTGAEIQQAILCAATDVAITGTPVSDANRTCSQITQASLAAACTALASAVLPRPMGF